MVDVVGICPAQAEASFMRRLYPKPSTLNPEPPLAAEARRVGPLEALKARKALQEETHVSGDFRIPGCPCLALGVPILGLAGPQRPPSALLRQGSAHGL